MFVRAYAGSNKYSGVITENCFIRVSLLKATTRMRESAKNSTSQYNAANADTRQRQCSGHRVEHICCRLH